MSQKYFSTSSNIMDCIEQIQQKDELMLMSKLVKGRKQRTLHRPRDPILSQVYIGWQQQLIKTKRVNTQANLKHGNIKNRFSLKQSLVKKERYQPYLFSHSVQLPQLSKSKPNFHLKSIKDIKLSSKNRQGQVDTEQKEQEKSEINNNKSFKKEETIKKKLIKVVEKVYKDHQRSKSKQFEAQKQKNCHKNNIINKIKLDKLRKAEGVLKIKKEWFEVDILKLQTFFIKLIKNKYQIKQDRNLLDLKDETNFQISSIPKKQAIPDFIRQYKPMNPETNVDSLVKKQKFKIILDEEALYFGQVEDNKRVGEGILIDKTTKFQGYWANDSKIKGYEISNQGYYNGKFKNNQRNGQGQYLWKNGQKYEGQWRNGLKNGSGVWKSGKGDSYIGQWINGKVEGYGVHITSNGRRYQGYFSNYLKHGKGKQLFPNGDIYQGQYRAGKPHGKGKYTWKNQIYYEGQFVQGYRHGKGVITAQKYMKFKGQFIAQKAHGRGQMQYENGDSFVGQFKQSQKNGKGVMKYKSNHKIVQGQWKNNQLLQQID